MKSNLFMRKIRNFLCFFICSFHLNCPTTEEQITDRQVLLGVTQKVLSNSKHTLLLCFYGHNVLGRINLIPLKTLRWFAQWLEAQSLQGPAHFLATKG